MSRFNNFLNEKSEDNDKILSYIMDFFADNPSPPDEDIHKLAKKLNLEPDDFEAKIYSILGSILGSGKAKKEKFTEKDANPNELKMGIKIEHEHTKNKTIAKRIALDHLAELPDYYTRLKKMEGDK